LQISALLGERVVVKKKNDTVVGEDMAQPFSVVHPILIELELSFSTNLASIFGG
jgi:hypothetical protein